MKTKLKLRRGNAQLEIEGNLQEIRKLIPSLAWVIDKNVDKKGYLEQMVLFNEDELDKNVPF